MASKETLRLGDVCAKIGSGATPRGGKESYKGGATALVRSQNVYNHGFERDGIVYIDDNQAADLANVELHEGDVLLNITGDSVARCCQIARDVLPARVNQHVAIIRTNPDKLDARFLRYVLVSPDFQSHLLALASAGATRNALTKRMIENLTVPRRELPEQERIAHILGTLDDKIELNRRMNATLEAMARALFQSWFVDFDPVRAKAAGQTPAGMDPATAALFPSEFEDSALGEIPKGWAVKAASEVLDINPPRRLKAGTVAPYIDMKNMPTHGHAVEDVIDRIAGSGSKFISGDTLLARITPCLENGKTAFIDCLPDDETVAWGSTEYIVLRPKPPLPPEYAYYLARSDAFRGHAIQSMTGTSGRQRVPTTCFEHFKMAVPPAPIARVFGETVRVLMDRIRSNVAESRTLAALRDALLPELLSGRTSADEARVLEGSARCQ